MRKNISAFVLSLLLMLSLPAAAFAENAWLGLGNAAVDEMFTERDFDTGYGSVVDITLADGSSSASGKGVSIDRDTVTITHEGVYRLSGSLSNGQIVVYAADASKVQLVLDGVSVTNEGGAAIQVVRADKVFVTTAAGSENSLSSVGKLIDEDVDGAVFSKNDICFNGEGMLRVLSEAGHGIATKDDLKITSGSYEIQAEKRGLSGKDSIRIGGGNIRVKATGDGLHSEHDDADKGYIFISGGSIDIVSGKDGIDCTNYLNILAGNISIDAASDGINVAGADDFDSSTYVAVSGGKVSVRAAEDGIDSNGSLAVHGGELYISAAPRGGDGALDYATAAEIHGGTVAAASAAEMAMNFSYADAQGSILCSFRQPHSAGEELSLRNEAGEVLLSFVPDYDYQAVVLSCAAVTAEGKYSVSAGEETVEIQMDGSLYGSSSGFGFPGGPGMMPPADMGDFPEFPQGMEQPQFPGDGDRPGFPGKPDGMKKPGKF